MGRQADKFVILGSMFGSERSTFQSTSEMFRHTNRAGSFVQSGKYTYFDDTPQAGMEGTGSARSNGAPVFTHSPV
jgi:hypothetical protein